MKKRKPKKPKYFLNFIGEFWNVKPKYQDWVMGRVEIFREDEKWAIDELRFFTPYTKEWDFKDVDSLETSKKLLTKFQR